MTGCPAARKAVTRILLYSSRSHLRRVKAALASAAFFKAAGSASGLHRRIRKAEPDRLAYTAFRRTLGPTLLVIFLLALLGAVLEAYAPGAASIGAVFTKAPAG